MVGVLSRGSPDREAADAGSGGSDGDAVVTSVWAGAEGGTIGRGRADGLTVSPSFGSGLATGAQATTSRARKAVAVIRGIEVRIAVVSGR